MWMFRGHKLRERGQTNQNRGCLIVCLLTQGKCGCSGVISYERGDKQTRIVVAWLCVLKWWTSYRNFRFVEMWKIHSKGGLTVPETEWETGKLLLAGFIIWERGCSTVTPFFMRDLFIEVAKIVFFSSFFFAFFAFFCLFFQVSFAP